MKKINYLHVVLTVIALLLALLVWEQRYVVANYDDTKVFNRITGKATNWGDHR